MPKRRLHAAGLIAVKMSCIALLSVWSGHPVEAAEGEGPTPDYALAESNAARASETNPQVVHENVFEDYHYAFRLRRPSSDWRFMNQETVHALNADSMMGLANPGKRGFMVVIAEPLDGMTVHQYADLILGNMSMAPLSDSERTILQIDGRPAVRVKRRATIQQIDFTYRIQFVQRDNFFYQMLAWTMTSRFESLDPQFLAVADSLTFAKDRQPRVPSTAGSRDDQGFDWRIANNVYSNASFGFRLAPGDGFRLAGREELASMNADASAGVISASPTFYQVYIVEQVGNIDRNSFMEVIVGQYEKGLGIGPDDTNVSQVRVGGVGARHFDYRKINVGGAVFDFGHTIFFRDSVCYRIQSWWPSAEAERSFPKLAQSYDHFRWLDRGEREQLAAGLATADINNFTGPQFSQRNGVFRDFRFGYSLKTPPGLWQATSGDALREQNPDARLMLQSPAEGITVIVIPETLEMEHAEYHGILRETLGAGDNVATRTVKGDGTELLVSAFDTTTDALGFSYRLVTAAQGKQRIQLLMSGLLANREALTARLPDLVAGFSFDSPASMIEANGPTTTDHRLGFRVTAPRGWTLSDSTPPQIQPIGTMLVMENQQAACVAIGVCAPTGFNEEMAIDALIQNSKIKIDPASRVELESTLAGLPGRQVLISGSQGRHNTVVRVWMAKRAHTTYLLLAVVREGSREHQEPEILKGCLTLID